MAYNATFTAAGGGSATFAEIAEGFAETANARFLDQFFPEGLEYETDKPAAPGRDGTDTVWMGFRGRFFAVNVIYIGADCADCHSMLAEDNDLFGSMVAAAVAGVNIPACKALPYRVIVPAHQTGYGTACLHVRFEFEQHRLTA